MGNSNPALNLTPCINFSLLERGQPKSANIEAVILLGGAEVNAFYAQGKRALPNNLAVMVHDFTHGLPKGEEEVQGKQGA